MALPRFIVLYYHPENMVTVIIGYSTVVLFLILVISALTIIIIINDIVRIYQKQFSFRIKIKKGSWREMFGCQKSEKTPKADETVPKQWLQANAAFYYTVPFDVGALNNSALPSRNPLKPFCKFVDALNSLMNHNFFNVWKKRCETEGTTRKKPSKVNLTLPR